MGEAQVYFVGAGPGAVDLITVRGAELLKKAKMVIYAGSLVNPKLLKYTSDDCEVFNSARMTLEEVIACMVRGANEGKPVVRLHTGDPSLYGAVKEQMEALKSLGITYESCPGVSACFGAAASLDLEYTLPEVSQSLIITRMAGRTGVPEPESIESFAAHRSTMAIYLSTSMLGELGRRLIKGGYPPSTPAAIVYKATWPDEVKVICTVASLEDEARKHNIRKTALILVGDVIGTTDIKKSRLYAADFSTEFRKASK